MTFNLKINMDNDAFVESRAHEVSRILSKLVAGMNSLEDQDAGILKDANGNTVGTWEVA